MDLNIGSELVIYKLYKRKIYVSKVAWQVSISHDQVGQGIVNFYTQEKL